MAALRADHLSGGLLKMLAEPTRPVSYLLPIGETRVELETLLGHEIEIEFTGIIRCIACGRQTRKSFQQGHCFPCLRRLARCDRCIIKPELCHFDLGTCREPDWGRANCMQPHVVYLANSSGLKVGITRESHLPVRWLDQGATQALVVLRVPSRRISGLCEDILRGHVSDRTDWRRMLSGEAPPLDLRTERDRVLEMCADGLAGVERASEIERVNEAEVQRYEYPVQTYPERVKSINPDKTPQLCSRLVGAKGQYLIFEDGVLNVRRYAGYEVSVSRT